ncbi:hypothetical protein CDD81_3294 [Ophiocordyceps australis]|uniref:GYF domain-containing protein n=1 Tax=Ophiocordyceps australis TaxID=1399860 RepID=A0A2C5YC15_9HYPO|nr:hypothetical protein CDD81_3294 [Ophiocordyceps australis]
MASRFSAARPKRAGENFARTHHHDGSDGKRVKFDVRNPSTLAPDARDDDAVLDADVIGGTSATKRGAVNLDGYDSDSDGETFDTKAAGRSKSQVDLIKKLDSYDDKNGGQSFSREAADDDDDDDDDDMFAVGEDQGAESDRERQVGGKKKDVRFLDAAVMEGEVETSKSGGRVRLDERESSDDEEDVELAIQEEGIDDEVGAGGLKRNAPKIEAFNLREEMEQGRFDDQGNYVRKAEDPDAVHDNWLEGLSKKDMKKAAEAHDKRISEARKQRIAEDGILIGDLLKTLIVNLEKAETPMEALARLGRQMPKAKKVPQWKLKKLTKSAQSMDVDPQPADDSGHAGVKESIDAITDAADKLLSRDYQDIYEQEREVLVREFRRETGEDWVEAKKASRQSSPSQDSMWEFRWTDGRDGGTVQGPYEAATMKAWDEAGYFGQGVEFRPADGSSAWSAAALFG